MSVEHDAHLLREHGPGTVYMKRCGICGWERWASTKTDGENSVVREPLQPEYYEQDQCGSCLEVMQRAPELARWVVGVVREQLQRKAVEE